MAAPPPPPPGKWQCPKCKKPMTGYAGFLGCPSECLKHGPLKHRVCVSCHVQEAQRAIQAPAVTGNSQTAKITSLCMPGPAKCGYPGCDVAWTFYDFLKCGDAVVEHCLAASLETAIAEMSDSVVCPFCLMKGFTSGDPCGDATCHSCKGSFCSGCKQRPHKGNCADLDKNTVISTAPEKYMSLRSDIMESMQVVQRKDLSVPGGVAFTLSSVITYDSCEKYDLLEDATVSHPTDGAHNSIIKAAEQAKFQSLEKMFPNDYRSNDRLLVKSPHIAAFLFERLVESLDPADLRHTPMGPSGSGIWVPCRMNELLKIGRYRPSCLFKAHRDGPWCPTMDEMSVFTFVLYLNDGEVSEFAWMPSCSYPFKGGHTRFIADDDSKKVYASVAPQRGMALIFSQHLPHEGAAILTGMKYILRTEVMFRRVRSVLDPTPAFLSACEDLKRIAEAYDASNKAIDTDKDKFLAEYLKAIEIQAKPLPQSDKLPLSDDVVLLVLEYLGNTAVLTKFGQLNKTCYRLSRDNSLWRRRMHLHFPEIAGNGPQNLSVNWLARYRAEFESVWTPNIVTTSFIGSSQYSSSHDHQRGKSMYPVTRTPAFYTQHEESTYSHGSRWTYIELTPVTEDQVRHALFQIVPVWPNIPGFCELFDATGNFTQQGLDYIGRTLNPIPKTLQAIITLPDDWTCKLQLDYMQHHGYRRRMPLFAVSSVAVAKAHGFSSCIVFHYGCSAHMLSVVHDNTVVRCQRIKNLRPTAEHANVLATLINNMLLQPDSHTALTPEEERIITLIKSDKSASAPVLLQHLNSVIEKRCAADIMTPAVARKTIGYQVVATGGRIIAHAQFLPMLRSALLERDANWKVSKTDTPMDDVINGVSRLRIGDFRDGTPVFTYGTVLALQPLPPVFIDQLVGKQ